MEFRRLKAENLTRAQFDQMIQMELDSGLEPYPPEMLTECLARMDTFGCFDGARLVGFITVSVTRLYFGGSIYIVNLNVARAYRRQGIAKRLMYTVYESCGRRFADRMVSLDVQKTNPAVELYRAVGFRIADIASRNGDTDIVMAMPMEDFGRRLAEILT